MKALTILSSYIIALTAFSVHAQVQTLIVSPTSTNSAVITLSSNNYAVVKSITTDYDCVLLVNLQGVDFSFNPTWEPVANLTFAGPGTIKLQGTVYSPAYATIEVVPGPFPPGKTLTVGANRGNVQVTMQMSTDLVSWAPAINGMTYTNSPDTRFFRIQLITNAQGL